MRMNPRLARWFTPGLHVKRWLLLLMVGMVLISLGVGYLLRNVYYTVHFPSFVGPLTLQFLDRRIRAVLFGAVGISLIALALYKLTQSVLGPFMLGSDRTLAEIIYN